MITLSDTKTNKPELEEISAAVVSMGLVIPFQPSLVDLKSIHANLNYTLELVQAKLESNYQEKHLKTIIDRLKKIFSKLNYNSHRESVAIIIKEEEEKIIYLNYSGKPVLFINDTFSLLDLVANSFKNPEFQLLVLNRERAELYEYFNNSQHKVFEQTPELCTDINSVSECLFLRITNILKLINKRNDKPIFVFSQDEQQTNKFCEYFPYREIVFKLKISSEEDIPSTINFLGEKIKQQWDHWQAKLVRGQIAIAKKNVTLFSHLNSVIKALKRSNDGLLLIDRLMKDEIHKSLEDETSFLSTQKLTVEIEKFLARGNRIEITEAGLLETFGGIALIKEKDEKFESYRFMRNYKEEDFLI